MEDTAEGLLHNDRMKEPICLFKIPEVNGLKHAVFFALHVT